MLDEFVEKYASILNGRDVNELFNHLRELMNRSEAARICDLERRTTYYWEHNREVRLSTKQKVLRTILEKDFEHTVKYMLNRIYNASSDILRLYLGTIYEKAMDPEIEPTQFQMLINEFREARIKYSPLAISTMSPEISDMFENLRKGANELNIDFPPVPMSAMNVEEVTNLLPQLMRVVPMSVDDDALEISEKFRNVPEDLLKFASDLKTISILVSSMRRFLEPLKKKGLIEVVDDYYRKIRLTKLGRLALKGDAVNLLQWGIGATPKVGENVPVEKTFTLEDLENSEKILSLWTSASAKPRNYIL